jgi:hypothetical protein
VRAAGQTLNFPENTMEQNPYQAPTVAPRDPRRIMICQGCGIEAPTRYVEFYQNIGALVMRFHKSIKGNLCKSCVHKRFWEFTLTNLLLGWWGMISLVVTPIFILNNVGRYLMCLGMATAPPDAAPPRLTDDAIERISPHADMLIGRLNAGEKLDIVAHDVAAKCGASPGKCFSSSRP